MTQHFLLSRAARSLSLAKVVRLSDDEVWTTFKLIRWCDTNGEPFCPRCGCLKHSFIATGKLFKCAGSATKRPPEMALPQVVNTLRAKRDQVEARIVELRRQLDAAERDLSSLTAVLSLYDMSPGTQTRFPAYAHLNRLFAYGEMFKPLQTSPRRSRQAADDARDRAGGHPHKGVG